MEQQQQYPVEMVQQQPQQYPESYDYPPISSGNNDKADLLEKIKPDAIVEIIRHKLMGEEIVNDAWVGIEALKDRAISPAGAWDISNLMLSASSQNVAISKLKDHEIRARSLAIANTAQKMLLKNWKEYGIKGIEQLDFVHQIVFTNTFITLKQCENEGIRNLIKGITTEQKVITEREESKKGWGSLLRR